MQLEILLAAVEQTLKTCIETTAMSEALASLLIDKGLLTKEELDAKIAESSRERQRISDALGSEPS
jgi:hypothetical protein